MAWGQPRLCGTGSTDEEEEAALLREPEESPEPMPALTEEGGGSPPTSMAAGDSAAHSGVTDFEAVAEVVSQQITVIDLEPPAPRAVAFEEGGPRPTTSATRPIAPEEPITRMISWADDIEPGEISNEMPGMVAEMRGMSERSLRPPAEEQPSNLWGSASRARVILQGAIPKRWGRPNPEPMNVEEVPEERDVAELESEEARVELELYLQGGSKRGSSSVSSPTSEGTAPSQTPLRRPVQAVTPTPHRRGGTVLQTVPIHADRAAWRFRDEDWDREDGAPTARRDVPVPRQVEEDETEPPRRKSRKRKKPYNPRRLLTVEDYFPLYLPSRENSPEPGGPVTNTSPGEDRRGREGRRQEERVREPSPEEERFECPGEEAWKRYNFPLTRLPLRSGGVLFRDGKPTPVEPAIDPPPYCCINCWDRNHSVRCCPEPERNNYCINCGRHGITIEECPRCSETNRRREQRHHTGPRSWSPPKKLASRSRRESLNSEPGEREASERRGRKERWRAEEERREREEEANCRHIDQRMAARRADEARQGAGAQRREEERRKEEDRRKKNEDGIRKEREEEELRLELLRQMEERRAGTQRVASAQVESGCRRLETTSAEEERRSWLRAEESRRVYEEKRLREQHEELRRVEMVGLQIQQARLRAAEGLGRVEAQRRALAVQQLQGPLGLGFGRLPVNEAPSQAPQPLRGLDPPRDPVREALELLEGLQGVTNETKDAVLRRIYGGRQ